MSTQPKVPVLPLAQWNLLNLRGGLGFRLFWSAGLPFHLLGTAAPGQQHHHLHLPRLWTFICPIHSNLKNSPNSHRSNSHSCFKRKEKVWFRILKSYSILISLKSLQNPEFWSKILCQNPKKPCRNAIRIASWSCSAPPPGCCWSLIFYESLPVSQWQPMIVLWWDMVLVIW